MAQMCKSVLSSISLKRYIMHDAITTLPFNHPLLEKYIYPSRENKTDLELLQTEEINETVRREEEIYFEHRPLYVMKKIFNDGRLKGKNKQEDYIRREKFSDLVIRNAFRLVDDFD